MASRDAGTAEQPGWGVGGRARAGGRSGGGRLILCRARGVAAQLGQPQPRPIPMLTPMSVAQPERPMIPTPNPRRIVPGEFMAVDPKGRACMIAAVEKSKFVYVLNRDNEARLTISSPLEAHKVRAPSLPSCLLFSLGPSLALRAVYTARAGIASLSWHAFHADSVVPVVLLSLPAWPGLLTPPVQPGLPSWQGSTLCYGITGLDMGFDNPVFAAIELDYAEADQVWGAAPLHVAGLLG